MALILKQPVVDVIPGHGHKIQPLFHVIPEHGHDPLLEGGPAGGEDSAGLGQLLVHVVVRQQVGCRHLDNKL